MNEITSIPPTSDLVSKDFTKFFQQGHPIRNGLFLQCVANFCHLETAWLGTWIIDYAMKVEGQDGLTWGQEIIPQINTGYTTKIIPLTNGTLVYLRYRTVDNALSSGVPYFGAAYIINSPAVANSLILGTLFQTTWSDFFACGFPFSPVENVQAQVGTLRRMFIANPAPGNNLIWSPRTGCRIKLLHIGHTLTTDANVANRNAYVAVAKTGGAVYGQTVDGANHAASLVRVYTWTLTTLAPVTTGSTVNAGSIIERLGEFTVACDASGTADQLQMAVRNIQGTDQISDLVFVGYLGFGR